MTVTGTHNSKEELPLAKLDLDLKVKKAKDKSDIEQKIADIYIDKDLAKQQLAREKNAEYNERKEKKMIIALQKLKQVARF